MESDVDVGIRITPPDEAAEEQINMCRETINTINKTRNYDIHRVFRSTTKDDTPSSACTRRPDEIGVDGFSSSRLAGTNSGEEAAAAAAAAYREERGAAAKERVRHTVAAGVHLLRIGFHLERGSVTHLLMEPS
ncbi:hypothetical protein F511_14484 [Dorcoceras hygrometricum]|uniref:Uncharacterized protein n=1 Tax=Dorcoceras hygrometricum TaxID=472368 RepID=A0A2Z7C860_9LAMI|nr:hypothetical protein F511_14484 [Dorcoceras hygrometricum]